MAIEIFRDKWNARETLEKEILEELIINYLRWRPEEEEDFFRDGYSYENYMYYVKEYMYYMRERIYESGFPSYCNCGERREDGFSLSLVNRRGDTIVTRYACICPECGAIGGRLKKSER